MKSLILVATLAVLAVPGVSVRAQAGDSLRILIVSSYHREYLWSQDTAAGVNAALLEAGWLDNAEQASRLRSEDEVRSSRARIRKLWMDTKRANARAQIAAQVSRIVANIDDFRPHVLLLGDDNATNYIGRNYLDSRIPVVFWGVNGNPKKYDLIDSVQRPGHNVTGVYQAGYLKEGILWLRKLLPSVVRLGVLSDASPTGRAKVKEIERLTRSDELPVELAGVVVTDSYDAWKSGALELARDADAIFVLNHNTLRDAEGMPVSQLEAGAWYLSNVRKPDIGHERQFVVEGVLCAVDDSGYRQGYEAVRIARRILELGEHPSTIPVYAPPRGNFVVNLARARMLGLSKLVSDNPLVEQRVPTMLALPDWH
jgi:ABC-type uncharacterized transport system substrate-binding protein